MRESLQSLNEIFHVKARLGIMTILISNGESDFVNLKKQLELTDGNLGAHLRVLEEARYLTISKSFIGRRPHTACQITDQGRDAFLAYVEQLEKLIQSVKSNQGK